MNTLLRNAINKLYDGAPVAPTCNALAKKLKSVCDIAHLLYQKTRKKLTYVHTLKDIAEEEVREEEEETEEQEKEQKEEEVDLVPQGHERALKGSYKSFVIHGSSKFGINDFVDQSKPHIKMLLEDQLKEKQSRKVIMMLWVRWKKPVKSIVTLHPEDLEEAQYILGNTGDNYIGV